jgi:sulfur carrier protein
MNLVVNGELHSFEEKSTLGIILGQLQIESKVMACAVNQNIIQKTDWNTFVPCDGDVVECLHFVGGG